MKKSLYSGNQTQVSLQTALRGSDNLLELSLSKIDVRDREKLGEARTWPILQSEGAMWKLLHGIKVCKQDTRAVPGNADEDMPCPMQVRKFHRRPHVAEHPVVDPTQDGHHPGYCGTYPQPNDSTVTAPVDRTNALVPHTMHPRIRPKKKFLLHCSPI